MQIYGWHIFVERELDDSIEPNENQFLSASVHADLQEHGGTSAVRTMHYGGSATLKYATAYKASDSNIQVTNNDHVKSTCTGSCTVDLSFQDGDIIEVVDRSPGFIHIQSFEPMPAAAPEKIQQAPEKLSTPFKSKTTSNFKHNPTPDPVLHPAPAPEKPPQAPEKFPRPLASKITANTKHNRAPEPALHPATASEKTPQTSETLPTPLTFKTAPNPKHNPHPHH